MAINSCQLRSLHKHIFVWMLCWSGAFCAPLPPSSPLPIRTESFDFYQDYLAKYYPKVFVMCRDYFVDMTPQEFEKALAHVVELITRQPWFYFVNRPQGFKITRYWELITDQLSWLSEFMHTACCDAVTNKIYLPTQQDEDDFLRAFLATGSFQSAKKNMFVDEYLMQSGGQVIYDFYALSFDYLVKLFNEAVLIESVESATYYFAELEFVAEKLQHSCHEAEYQEHLTTAKELLELLKQRLTYVARLNES
jgi:hypothetical protein